MTGIEAVTLVGVLVAAIGYFIKHGTDLRLAQRNDRLERINRHLSEFYGPLLALCAHVAGYQAIIKEWETGEVSLLREDDISLVNFPGHELADYATTRFGRL